MNLDQTFCASDCCNYTCKRMVSYSICCAAEARQRAVSHADFSKECEHYAAPGTQQEDASERK